MFNKLTIAPIVALAYAALAWFGVVLPPSMTQPAVVAAVMMSAAAVTAVLRFGHGDVLADAKAWYLSRVIWVQIIAAAFAALALFGVVPEISQQGALEAVMAVVAFLSWVLGAKTTRPLG